MDVILFGDDMEYVVGSVIKSEGWGLMPTEFYIFSCGNPVSEKKFVD